MAKTTQTVPQLSLLDSPKKSAAAAAPPPPPAVEEKAAKPELVREAPKPAGSKADATPPARRSTAEAMAQKQREISISEFFTKNRHLLGFDNPSKALLTTIKEAVDNSLDACEEAGGFSGLLGGNPWGGPRPLLLGGGEKKEGGRPGRHTPKTS